MDGNVFLFDSKFMIGEFLENVVGERNDGKFVREASTLEFHIRVIAFFISDTRSSL